MLTRSRAQLTLLLGVLGMTGFMVYQAQQREPSLKTIQAKVSGGIHTIATLDLLSFLARASLLDASSTVLEPIRRELIRRRMDDPDLTTVSYNDSQRTGLGLLYQYRAL